MGWRVHSRGGGEEKYCGVMRAAEAPVQLGELSLA